MPVKEIPLPSFQELHALLSYDRETGILTWKARDDAFGANRKQMAWNRKYAGKRAGTIRKTSRKPTPYHFIAINDRQYKASRLIWKMMTAHDPVGVMDHRNRNTLDDSWLNLREATRQENCFNKKGHVKRKYDLPKGVIFVEKGKRRFRATITKNGESYHLGVFSDAEDAAKAYNRAALAVHGEFACLNEMGE